MANTTFETERTVSDTDAMLRTIVHRKRFRSGERYVACAAFVVRKKAKSADPGSVNLRGDQRDLWHLVGWTVRKASTYNKHYEHDGPDEGDPKYQLTSSLIPCKRDRA